jgi:hypothetical protein
MDVGKILAELSAERQQIESAILSLERLARGRHRGPGRPPNLLADFSSPTPKRRGRPPGSKNKFHQPYDPNDPPPAAAMPPEGPEQPPAVEIGVRVPNPKPKPKLPPATAAADLPETQS